MNMNEKTNQILLEQNKSCHENSNCILCSPQTQVRGATWVHMDDIPKMKSIGWPLYYDSESNMVLISNQMGHYLGIGSTGSGKTQCAVLNTIDIHSRMSLDKKPSLFITDQKGEITQKCANLLRKRGYELHIIDTRNPESSSRWNPISGIFDDYQKIIGLQKQLKSKKRMTTEDKNNIERKSAKLRERIERGIAELSNITISLKGAKEIGWPTGARNMMRAIIYTMLFDSENPQITGMTREKFTLENVARIAFSTEDDCEYLIDYLTRASERFLTVKNALASNYNIRAKQTRDSYISSCNTPLGEYTSYSISALTSSSTDIDFERVACGDKPYAFILITDERNPTTNIFSMMFLNKMISDFVDYADNSP